MSSESRLAFVPDQHVVQYKHQWCNTPSARQRAHEINAGLHQGLASKSSLIMFQTTWKAWPGSGSQLGYKQGQILEDH